MDTLRGSAFDSAVSTEIFSLPFTVFPLPLIQLGLSSSDDEGPSSGGHEDAKRDGFASPTTEQRGPSPPVTPVLLRESLDSKVCAGSV